MKILVTLTYYRPYISGLTKYAENLTRGLAKRGHQMTVLSMRYSPELKKEEIQSGIKIVRSEPLCKISKGFVSVEWIWQSIKEVNKSEAVIVNLPGPDAIIAAGCAKLRHKKLIVLYHCDAVLTSKLSERMIDMAHSLILKLADIIVTNTKDYANESRLLRSFSDKATYIYPIITKPPQRIRKKINNVFTIGWVGRIAREKGLEYLLESIPYLEKTMDFKIKLAGPGWTAGEETYRREILELINKYKNKAEIAGQLSDHQLENFYRQIDLLVLPSVNATETLGMVQLEAMAAGIPVVASNLPGVRQPILQIGRGLLVEPKNSQQLAKAIIHIYKHPAKFSGKIPLIFDPETGLDAYEHLLLS